MSELEKNIGLLARGVEGIYSLEELKKKLASGKTLRVKLGMDPTAPDIHLGHSVVLRKMRQFQDLGHKAVLIIGDYTARIGDPTGRDTTRPVLDSASIDRNAKTYLDQAGKILDSNPDKLEVRFNSEWLSKLSFVDVLKLTGMVTVQQMLHRENFKLRMQNNTEIILTEFMYPIMQGYDSVVINADIELGGTDQTFNNLVGRQLQAKHGMDQQVVMVMPLLVGLDGHEKMSKSKHNYIGLTEPANEMFGKVMSIPDSLMPNYFKLLTSIPEERIVSLTTDTHPRVAKEVLGKVIVEEFHNAGAAHEAAEEFRRRFTEGALPSDLQTKTVPASIDPINLVVSLGFATSKSDARRLIEQGAVSLDDQKITDFKAVLSLKAGQILRVGKRNICKLAV